ncbi:MAG: tyrosine-type recombinase/integrase [Micromonosporaceae bacterium]|nr:tyrosine-type recombinase/integrase [Micromonosporaceae bacterium]
MGFRVQRLRSADTGAVSFTVVGVDGLPLEAVEAFLSHLAAVGRSPNTVAGYAHDLRDFMEWLDQSGRDFRGLSLEELTEFFAWVSRPVAARVPGVFMLPGTPVVLEAATLIRKRAALASFYRFHARRDAAVPAVLGELIGPRGTGPFTPMLVHTRRGRLGSDAYSPMRMSSTRKPPVALSQAQVARLVAACRRCRDRFLLVLLDQTGLRIGEALGLRHADLHLRAGQVEVVPRGDNVNGARVKGLKARVVPAPVAVFDAYADYMEAEYGTLDCDWVFVNLFRPPVGAPMTADTVAKLAARLRDRTGITSFTPHTLRHGYATRLLRAGVPVEVVAELMGHASPTTTSQTYSHLQVEDHRRALVAAGVLA